VLGLMWEGSKCATRRRRTVVCAYMKQGSFRYAMPNPAFERTNTGVSAVCVPGFRVPVFAAQLGRWASRLCGVHFRPTAATRMQANCQPGIDRALRLLIPLPVLIRNDQGESDGQA
jgi:hypothetical protein